jgi:hydrogenase maturation protease
MFVIGCGNPGRSDDGAGILVALRLRQLGLDARAYTGESLGLIDLWEPADEVILVDAVVTGAPAGTIHVLEGLRSSLPTEASASTHGLGIAEAIELARCLNRLPSHLQIYGIEGHCFALGTSVSIETQRAVEEVVRRIIVHPRLRSLRDHMEDGVTSLTASSSNSGVTMEIETSSKCAALRGAAGMQIFRETG